MSVSEIDRMPFLKLLLLLNEPEKAKEWSAGQFKAYEEKRKIEREKERRIKAGDIWANDNIWPIMT